MPNLAVKEREEFPKLNLAGRHAAITPMPQADEFLHESSM